MSQYYRVEFEFKPVENKAKADILRDILEEHGMAVEDGDDKGEYWAFWGPFQLCGGVAPGEVHQEIRRALPSKVRMRSAWWWDEHPPDEVFEDDGFTEDLVEEEGSPIAKPKGEES